MEVLFGFELETALLDRLESIGHEAVPISISLRLSRKFILSVVVWG